MVLSRSVARGAVGREVAAEAAGRFFARTTIFGALAFGALARLAGVLRITGFDRATVRFAFGRMGRFAFGRLTGRFGERRPLVFRAIFDFCAPRAAFRRGRLDIIRSLRNLDSFAISIVLSVAYRKSARARCTGFGLHAMSADRNCGPPDPATERRQSNDPFGKLRVP